MTTSFSQISKKRRDAMDLLTEAELIFEIKRGPKSRFSQSLHYLEYRLHKIEDEKAGKAREEDLAIARESNYLSKEANQYSAKANSLSKWAIAIAIFALIVSILTVGYEIYSKENPNNKIQPTAESGG
jgi:hypothetical protein